MCRHSKNARRSFTLSEGIRPKYACPNKQGGVVQALAPVHLIEGGLPTEGTLAHVATSKYADLLRPDILHQGTARTAGGVIDGHDRGQAVVDRIEHQMRHEVDHLARGEVFACLFIVLFVELADWLPSRSIPLSLPAFQHASAFRRRDH